MKPLAYAALFISVLLTGCQIGTFTDPNGTGSTASQSKQEPTSDNPSSVMLYWSAPMERINGENMTSGEVGGYEIRFRHIDESEFTSIVVDSGTTQWPIETPSNADNFIFEVAVFDTDGIYSDFVRAKSQS